MGLAAPLPASSFDMPSPDRADAGGVVTAVRSTSSCQGPDTSISRSNSPVRSVHRELGVGRPMASSTLGAADGRIGSIIQLIKRKIQSRAFEAEEDGPLTERYRASATGAISVSSAPSGSLPEMESPSLRVQRTHRSHGLLTATTTQSPQTLNTSAIVSNGTATLTSTPSGTPRQATACSTGGSSRSRVSSIVWDNHCLEVLDKAEQLYSQRTSQQHGQVAQEASPYRVSMQNSRPGQAATHPVRAPPTADYTTDSDRARQAIATVHSTHAMSGGSKLPSSRPPACPPPSVTVGQPAAPPSAPANQQPPIDLSPANQQPPQAPALHPPARTSDSDARSPMTSPIQSPRGVDGASSDPDSGSSPVHAVGEMDYGEFDDLDELLATQLVEAVEHEVIRAAGRRFGSTATAIEGAVDAAVHDPTTAADATTMAATATIHATMPTAATSSVQTVSSNVRRGSVQSESIQHGKQAAAVPSKGTGGDGVESDVRLGNAPVTPPPRQAGQGEDSNAESEYSPGLFEDGVLSQAASRVLEVIEFAAAQRKTTSSSRTPPKYLRSAEKRKRYSPASHSPGRTMTASPRTRQRLSHCSLVASPLRHEAVIKPHGGSQSTTVTARTAALAAVAPAVVPVAAPDVVPIDITKADDDDDEDDDCVMIDAPTAVLISDTRSVHHHTCELGAGDGDGVGSSSGSCGAVGSVSESQATSVNLASSTTTAPATSQAFTSEAVTSAMVADLTVGVSFSQQSDDSFFSMAGLGAVDDMMAAVERTAHDSAADTIERIQTAVAAAASDIGQFGTKDRRFVRGMVLCEVDPVELVEVATAKAITGVSPSTSPAALSSSSHMPLRVKARRAADGAGDSSEGWAAAQCPIAAMGCVARYLTGVEKQSGGSAAAQFLKVNAHSLRLLLVASNTDTAKRFASHLSARNNGSATAIAPAATGAANTTYDSSLRYQLVALRGSWWDSPVCAGDIVHVVLYPARSGPDTPAAGGAGRLLTFAPGAGVDFAVVDDQQNALVVLPDELISVTRVATSFECERKAVLSELVSGGGSASMPTLWGHLRHDLFEEALHLAMKKRADWQQAGGREAGLDEPWLQASELRAFINNEVLRPGVLLDLYSIDKTEADAVQALRASVHHVLHWVNQFTRDAPPPRSNHSTMGGDQSEALHGRLLMSSPGGDVPLRLKVDSVVATEDMVLSPVWGLKGQIDATVDATITALSGSGIPASTPRQVRLALELKTGKRGYGVSPQHRAQVALYTMLMSERDVLSQVAGPDQLFQDASAYTSEGRVGVSLGRLIDGRRADSGPPPLAGVLVYIHETNGLATDGVPFLWNEARSILQQRNRIAHGLNQINTSASSQSSPQSAAITQERGGKLPTRMLPPVVTDKFACKYCWASMQCAVWHAASDALPAIEQTAAPTIVSVRDWALQAAQETGLSDTYQTVLVDLRPPHLDYLARWLRVLEAEAGVAAQGHGRGWSARSQLWYDPDPGAGGKDGGNDGADGAGDAQGAKAPSTGRRSGGASLRLLGLHGVYMELRRVKALDEVTIESMLCGDEGKAKAGALDLDGDTTGGNIVTTLLDASAFGGGTQHGGGITSFAGATSSQRPGYGIGQAMLQARQTHDKANSETQGQSVQNTSPPSTDQTATDAVHHQFIYQFGAATGTGTSGQGGSSHPLKSHSLDVGDWVTVSLQGGPFAILQGSVTAVTSTHISVRSDARIAAEVLRVARLTPDASLRSDGPQPTAQQSVPQRSQSLVGTPADVTSPQTRKQHTPNVLPRLLRSSSTPVMGSQAPVHDHDGTTATRTVATDMEDLGVGASGGETGSSGRMWRIDKLQSSSIVRTLRYNILALFTTPPQYLLDAHAALEAIQAEAAVAAHDAGNDGAVSLEATAAALLPIDDDVLSRTSYTTGDVRRIALVVELQPPRIPDLAQIVLPWEATVPLPAAPRLPAAYTSALRREFEAMNESQQRAVRMAVGAKDYFLLRGMPGTGKTTAISVLVRILVAMGQSVLVTSYTNSAVDNVMIRLLDWYCQWGADVDGSLSPDAFPYSMVRLGRASAVHPAVKGISVNHAISTGTQDMHRVSHLRRVLEGAQIVGATCLATASHPVFERRVFDVCIVDEAAQITEPVCLGALRACKSFVLIGDEHQLPPLVQSEAAKQGGLGVSLFERLAQAHPQAVMELPVQYRMNDDIQVLPNSLMYNGRLRCGSKAVAEASLQPDEATLSPVLQRPSVVSCRSGNEHHGDSIEGAVDLGALYSTGPTNGLLRFAAAPTDRTTSDTQEVDWLRRVLIPTRSKSAGAHPSEPPLHGVVFLNTDTAFPQTQLEQRVAAPATTSPHGSAAPAAPSSTVAQDRGRPVRGISNPVEAVITVAVARTLVQSGAVSAGQIGVIAPYHAQLGLIRRVLKTVVTNITSSRERGAASDHKFSGAQSERTPPELSLAELEVQTVDTYQGRDKEVILLSMTRCNAEGAVGALLSDLRRLNVAFTRAKRKLVIIGSLQTLERGCHPQMQATLQVIRQRGWVQELPRGGPLVYPAYDAAWLVAHGLRKADVSTLLSSIGRPQQKPNDAVGNGVSLPAHNAAVQGGRAAAPRPAEDSTRPDPAAHGASVTRDTTSATATAAVNHMVSSASPISQPATDTDGGGLPVTMSWQDELLSQYQTPAAGAGGSRQRSIPSAERSSGHGHGAQTPGQGIVSRSTSDTGRARTMLSGKGRQRQRLSLNRLARGLAASQSPPTAIARRTPEAVLMATNADMASHASQRSQRSAPPSQRGSATATQQAESTQTGGTKAGSKPQQRSIIEMFSQQKRG